MQVLNEQLVRLGHINRMNGVAVQTQARAGNTRRCAKRCGARAIRRNGLRQQPVKRQCPHAHHVSRGRRLPVDGALPELPTVGANSVDLRAEVTHVRRDEVLVQHHKTPAPVQRHIGEVTVSRDRRCLVVMCQRLHRPRHARERCRRQAGVSAVFAPDVKAARRRPARRRHNVERCRRWVAHGRRQQRSERRSRKQPRHSRHDSKRQQVNADLDRPAASQPRRAVKLCADGFAVGNAKTRDDRRRPG